MTYYIHLIWPHLNSLGSIGHRRSTTQIIALLILTLFTWLQLWENFTCALDNHMDNVFWIMCHLPFRLSLKCWKFERLKVISSVHPYPEERMREYCLFCFRENFINLFQRSRTYNQILQITIWTGRNEGLIWL